ncbi:MAG: hypothetical protein WBD24_05275 [Candidatus Omnitrophota bacterium]
MAKWYNAKCPKCGEYIELNSLYEVGDQMTCRFCDTELEIKSMHPPRFTILQNGYSIDNEDYFDNDEEG